MVIDLPSRPRILAIRLSSLGDVVACLPAAGALRTLFPDAHIAWAVDDRFRQIVSGVGAIDEVVPFPRGANGSFERVADCLSGLAARPFDLAVDLHGNLRSGLVAWCSRAPVRLGFAPPVSREANWIFHTVRVAPEAGVRHRTHRVGALLRGLGHSGGLSPITLFPDPARSAQVRRWLTQHALGGGKLVVLHAGSSAGGAYKRWPAERCAGLAERFQARGLRVLLFAGPSDLAAVDEVRARMERPCAVTPVFSLGDALALLALTDLFVGIDSGPAALSQAAGTPSLVLFGPKDPADYGPVGPPHRTIHHPLPCSPCRNRGCEHVRCMGLVTVDEVERRALELLNAISSTPA